MSLEPTKSRTTQATVRGLLPNTDYVAQVRQTGGAWSPLLRFTTARDTTAPAAPTDLTIVPQAQAFVLNWTAPTTNADGSPLTDFRDYLITVYPTADPTRAVEFSVTETTLNFHLAMNRHYFGTPVYDLTFEVRARDLTLNRSEPAIGEATAPTLLDFTVTGEPLPRAIKLTWPDQPNADTYRVYRSTTPTVPLDSAHFAGSILSSQADVDRTLTFFDIPDVDYGTELYYAVEAIGFFEQLVVAPTVGPLVVGAVYPPGDDEAPLQPSAPKLYTDTQVVIVEHDLMDNAATPAPLAEDLSHFEVYLAPSGTALPWGEGYKIGTMAAPPPGSGLFARQQFPKPSTDNTLGWEARVIAVDFRNNRSEISAPSTAGTIKYIENAHISNLSAEKLIANTAFTTRLYVSSLGAIESSDFAAGGGYKLTNNFADFNSGRFRGTLEATGGFIETLNVTGTMNVGDPNLVTPSGTLKSAKYTGIGGNGWAIYASGSSVFNDVYVRGTIDATDGYLRTLTIAGKIGISSTGSIDINAGRLTITQSGIIAKDANLNETIRIGSDGNAIFRGRVEGATGYFGTISGGIFKGVEMQANVFKTDDAPNNRIEVVSGNRQRIHFYGAGGMAYIEEGQGGVNLPDEPDSTKKSGLRISGSLSLMGDTSGGILYCQGIRLRGFDGDADFDVSITPAVVYGRTVYGQYMQRRITTSTGYIYRDLLDTSSWKTVLGGAGTNGQILWSDGTSAYWGAPPSSTGGDHPDSDHNFALPHSHPYLQTSGGTVSGDITVSGSVGSATYASVQFGNALHVRRHQYTSDYRKIWAVSLVAQTESARSMKKNIEKKKGKLKQLKNMSFYEFEYRDAEKYGEGRRFGFMVDELPQEMLQWPEHYKEEEKTLENAHVDGRDMNIFALASVRELIDEVEELRDRVAQLEGNNNGA